MTININHMGKAVEALSLIRPDVQAAGVEPDWAAAIRKAMNEAGISAYEDIDEEILARASHFVDQEVG